MDYFVSPVTEEEIRRERAKARELRQSSWWKRKRGEGICYFCGGKFPPAALTMDHIVPIIRGGKSVKGNVVPACKECNNKKKHMLPLEWEEYLTTLRREE
ncbi:MAG: HNH endonuclease [Nitrospiraceae bacterium]|nr:HNH endonuclease [Nitrospiraceae bacterium]